MKWGSLRGLFTHYVMRALRRADKKVVHRTFDRLMSK